MIQTAGKYSEVKREVHKPPPTARPTFSILVKKLARAQSFKDWWFKEIREGGFLHTYVGREKNTMTDRFRAIAAKMGDWKQPAKTDFQLRAALPARLYHRLKQEDPHFFEDDRNLKNLKRDNPDAFVKV